LRINYSFFIHLFDSGSTAHKNTQITIDSKRKYRETKVHNNRHIVDKWKRTDRESESITTFNAYWFVGL